MGIQSFLMGSSGTASRDLGRRQTATDAKYAGDIGQIANKYGDLAGQADTAGSMESYLGALRAPSTGQIDASQYQVQAPDALGQARSYLDPSIDYQIEKAVGQTNADSAAQGNLFSGAAGQAIADTTRSIAETGYNNAFNQARQAGLDQNAATAQNFGTTLQGAGWNNQLGQQDAGNLGKAYGVGQNLMDTQSQIQGDLAGSLYNSGTQMNMARFGTQSQDTGFLSKAFDAGLGLTKSYLSGGR